jgi:predicted O-linked N-acetylglucosamine transferase (SPINDLY family)
VLPTPLCKGFAPRAGKARNDKIRVAYLAADFRSHVTAYQLAELFELHDHSRFEVIGVSFSRDDGSEIRARVIKAFDRFLDVYAASDREVANLLYESEVDIAVDLMGHTLDARLPIFAYRPAPIQATYHAYASTTGAKFIDYIIGDPIVLPVDHQSFYSEQIVRLPECFLANDSQRAIAEHVPSRLEAGLPEHGFVFCCFNNTVKLQPGMFDIWMRLLQAVEGSVLWLSPRYVGAQRNLLLEAQARGVDPSRLVFAQRVPKIEDHLARHRLADLFLDTLPYNAHATAGDALWAGLPVLTCRGKTYGARVAASLLQAVGLPELVTETLADYEALGLQLARDAALLGGLRQRLEQNRARYPLFDTKRLCRHLEDAYGTMWDIAQRGEAPRSFNVPARGRGQ